MKTLNIFSKKSKPSVENGLTINQFGKNKVNRLMMCTHDLDSLVYIQKLSYKDDNAVKLALKLYQLYTLDSDKLYSLALFINKQEHVREIEQTSITDLVKQCGSIESVSRASLVLLIIYFIITEDEEERHSLALLIKQDSTYECIDYLPSNALKILFDSFNKDEEVVDYITVNKLIDNLMS